MSTGDLQDLDRAHLWHPFTQMQEWVDPLIIERAEGNYLFDTTGVRYLDGISSLWTNVHGHNHPALNAAITSQLGRVAHTTLLGLSNVPAIQLAKRLVDLTPPPLQRVFYSDSGSTAVEVALKLAFQYHQLNGHSARRRFLRLVDSYHGDTLGAVGVGGMALFHEVYGPLVLESIGVPNPHPYRHPAGPDPEAVKRACLSALSTALERQGKEVAAFILEPLVQGAAGILVHPPGYLREAAALCRTHGVLVIADEVATGFGRTGRMFACDHEAVSPDIMCLAKGLSGGYLPLAATLVTDAIYTAFLGSRVDRRTFFHGHTYTGNPLACAVGLASLELFESEKVLERVDQRATTLAGQLARLRGEPWIGDIRQRGLMVGIELVANDRGSPFPPERGVGAAVCHAARRHGVLLRPLGDVIVLMPPLSVTDAECELLVRATRDAIHQVLH